MNKKFPVTGLLLWLLISFSGSLEAMEAVVGESAAKVFGEEISEVAQKALTKDVAEAMGVDLETFGSLPEETRSAFKTRLTEAFEALKGKSGTFTTLKENPELFKSTMINARDNFVNINLKEIGAKQGFSELKQSVLKKFGASEEFLSNFPFKSSDVDSVFKKSVNEMSPAEKEVNSASVKLQEARSDVEFARGAQDKSLAKQAEENLAVADKEYKQAEEVLTKQKDADLKQAQQEKDLADAQKEKAVKGGNNQDVRDANAKIEKAEEKVTQAKKEKELAERQSLDRQRKQALANRDGSAEQKRLVKEKQEALDKIKKDKAAAEKSGDLAKVKTLGDDQSAAEKELKDARRAAGTKGRLEVAKEELDEIKKTTGPDKDEQLKKAQEEYDEAEEQNKVASEEANAIEKEWLEKKSFFTTDKEVLKAKFKETAKGLIVEHVTNSIVGGFAFSVPNIIIEVIQGHLNRTILRDQLKKPQRFGGIWMQIPSDLINENAPTASKYLYVGLEKSPTDNVTSRVTDADTDVYFSKANFYLSINDYDEYGAAAIPDPNFPNAMVHLNTGYHFSSDGLPYDPVQPVVPLLEASQRAKALQMHLDEQSGQILRGIVGEVYQNELRKETTGYKGNKTIADRFDQTKNQHVPFDIKPPNSYGEVLASAIEHGPIAFGPYMIEPLKAISMESMAKISPDNKIRPADNKPYDALGQYIYQTTSTPIIASIIKNSDDPSVKSLIKDYVFAVDRDYRVIPFYTPVTTGSEYGFASYLLNPAVVYIVSIMAEKLYDKSGKEVKNALIDIAKLIEQEVGAGDQDLQGQISVMKHYVQNEATAVEAKLKYGPLSIGGATLTIDKNLFDKGVYVYTIDYALEDGSPDYVIAMALDADKHPVMTALPNDQIVTFISLVTSRFYDGNLVPYDKIHAGQKNTNFAVYKQPAGTFLLATGAPNSNNGQQLFSDSAPLYSIFMDPDINPNKPSAAQQKILSDNGALPAESAVLPVIRQWALSTKGPFADYDNSVRIGQLLAKTAPELKNSIDKTYNAWKSYLERQDAAAPEREMGPYRFTTDLLRNIIIRATGVQDIKNGNYVYISDYYPDEYLVLSDDMTKISQGAENYDLASPQQYAISLSSGKVYDAKGQGKEVTVITNLDSLMQQAQSVKAFSPALLKKITDSQRQHGEKIDEESEQNRYFGPFKLFISPEDLKNGHYIYADVSSIKNAESLDEKTLLGLVTDYFICIESPDGTNNNAQWVYGTKLSAATYRIVSLVSGALYDRGGTYQNTYAAYAVSAENNIDINQGFLQKIYNLAKITWGGDIRSVLRDRILALTSQQYNTLLAQREQIVKAQEQEALLYTPMNASLKANIDAQAYDDTLQNMQPARYVKKYNNKYYSVPPSSYDVGSAQPLYIDYNVGQQNKDNRLGVAYANDGSVVMRIEGWLLDVMRSYIGLSIKNDGSQLLDIALDHPAVPVDAMVLLDVPTATKKVAAMQAALKKAIDASGSNPTPDAKNNVAQATINLGFASQEYKSALAIAQASIKNSSDVTYLFYFNEGTGNYFVRLRDRDRDVYIDLTAGYVFEMNGKPALVKSPVIIAANPTRNDIILINQDQQELLTATYKGADGLYHSWILIEELPSRESKKNSYSMRSNDTDEESVLVIDTDKNQYSVMMVKEDTTLSDPLFYKIGLAYSSNLIYVKTRVGQNEGAFVQNDQPITPVAIIWDGQPNLALQSLFYNQQLLPLKKTGEGIYTADYKDGTVTKNLVLKEQSKIITPGITAHWISLVDGNKTYDYIYDTQVIDITSPITCPASLDYVYDPKKLLLKLNYWKECAWSINPVVTVAGENIIVNGLAVSSLLNVDSKSIKNVPDKKEVRSLLEVSLAQIYYDKNNRYVYMISPSDKGMPYYKDERNGWYVELSKGIVFDDMGYPRGSLLASELYLLLDKLGVSVIQVPSADGQLQYDNQGNPVIDPATKAQLKTKDGLSYRGFQKNEETKATVAAPPRRRK